MACPKPRYTGHNCTWLVWIAGCRDSTDKPGSLRKWVVPAANLIRI